MISVVIWAVQLVNKINFFKNLIKFILRNWKRSRIESLFAVRLSWSRLMFAFLPTFWMQFVRLKWINLHSLFINLKWLHCSSPKLISARWTLCFWATRNARSRSLCSRAPPSFTHAYSLLSRRSILPGSSLLMLFNLLQTVIAHVFFF